METEFDSWKAEAYRRICGRVLGSFPPFRLDFVLREASARPKARRAYELKARYSGSPFGRDEAPWEATAPVPARFWNQVWRELEGLSLPATAWSSMACDGSCDEIEIRWGDSTSRFRWWTTPPEEWSGLIRIFDRLSSRAWALAPDSSQS